MIPAICTPEWAVSREEGNRNEGGDEVLRRLIANIRDGVSQCHVRYGDGEFWSILGRVGPNADGQEHLPNTLGMELAVALKDVGRRPEHVMVGGYWFWPDGARQWLVENDLLCTLPWCPVSAMLTEIATGASVALLEALLASSGKRYLVANEQVCRLSPALKAIPVPVILPRRKLLEVTSAKEIATPNTEGWYGFQNAYTSMPTVERLLRNALNPGDAVIWCAGLGCKPSLWRLFREIPGTIHLDLGCFFDLAAGLKSRSWMTQPNDETFITYTREVEPWLKRRM